MIKLIKKPDWTNDLHWLCEERLKHKLDAWFAKHIEPLNKAIENGRPAWSRYASGEWSTVLNYEHKNYQGLLIDVQEIKKQCDKCGRDL